MKKVTLMAAVLLIHHAAFGTGEEVRQKGY
jgi:hypothetical protein